MKYSLVFAISMALGLSACGSSNKNNAQGTSPTGTSSTPTAQTQPTPVHNLAPDAVPDYIDAYKAGVSRLNLQINGAELTYSLFSVEDNSVIATTPLGLITLGFDMENEKPLKTMTLTLGDLNDGGDFEASAEIDAQDVDIEEQDEDLIYTGTLPVEGEDVLSVRIIINEAFISGGSTALSIEGNTATLTGELGTKTYVQLQDMLVQHPNVTRLSLKHVPGSLNDDINMHTGRLVRESGLTTYVPNNGFAASGGVDLFASGAKRELGENTRLGVHSWCCVDGKPANALPQNHQAHGAQLTYFREMLGTTLGPEFYFFTIKAADFEGIHIMTTEEIAKYQLVN